MNGPVCFGIHERCPVKQITLFEVSCFVSALHCDSCVAISPVFRSPPRSNDGALLTAGGAFNSMVFTTSSSQHGEGDGYSLVAEHLTTASSGHKFKSPHFITLDKSVC